MCLAVACAALSLTGCGGEDSGTPSTAVGSGTSASEAAPTSEPAAATTPGSGSGASAAELCDYLRGRLPELRGIGSEVGAMANLTVNLFTWYEQRGAIPNGSEIDQQTMSECPDVRTEVLEVAGIESFATL